MSPTATNTWSIPITSTGTSYLPTNPAPEAALARDEGLKPVPDGCDRDAFLPEGIAVADGYLLVLDGVEVDSDAEGGACLVLAAVAASDGTGVVVEEAVIPLEVVVELARYGRDGFFFREREDGGLSGGDAGVELQDGALLAVYLLLGVGVHEEGEHYPVRSHRGLYDVGVVAVVGGLVYVFEVLAGVLGVLLEVVVRAVCDPFELRPAGERVVVLDVHRALGVVGELLLGVLVAAEVLLPDAKVEVPVPALLEPVLVPLLVRASPHDALPLHLPALAGGG